MPTASHLNWPSFPHHPAGFTFGDRLVYGAGKTEREPLLFTGNDFAQTDIEPALKV